MIVADCTIIARLLLPVPDRSGVQALWLLDSGWAAAALWEPEFASVLMKYERAGHLGATGAAGYAHYASKTVTTHYVSIDRALASARRSGCSTYDSYYIALAEDLDVKLYTYDKEILRRCADRAARP